MSLSARVGCCRPRVRPAAVGRAIAAVQPAPTAWVAVCVSAALFALVFGLSMSAVLAWLMVRHVPADTVLADFARNVRSVFGRQAAMGVAFYAAILLVATLLVRLGTARRLRRLAPATLATRGRRWSLALRVAAMSSGILLWGAVLHALLLWLPMLGTGPSRTPALRVYFGFVYAVAGLIVLVYLVVALLAARRLVDHLGRLRCVCGYDLQGSAADRCSECGLPLGGHT